MRVAPKKAPSGSLHIQLWKLLHKVFRNVQDYGWLVTTEKVLQQLFGWLYLNRVYRIHKIRLSDFRPMQVEEPTGLRFKFLEPQEFPLIEQVESLAEWLTGTLQDRIAAGDLCLVALEKDRVVGFYLVTFGAVFSHILNRTLLFRAGEAWVEHIAVRKQWRGRRMCAMLRNRVFPRLVALGIRRVYSGILPSNKASQRSAQRGGLRPFVDIHYRKLLNSETWSYERLRHSPLS